MAINIQWVGTNGCNFWSGRNGYKPKAIVNHVMDGTKWGTKSHFQNCASEASTHFAVHLDGSIWQYVLETDTAWGNGTLGNPDMTNAVIAECVNGNINPNYETLSIEHEGMSGQTFTELQILSSIALNAYLANKYSIPKENIFGHYRLDSIQRPNCPGKTFFWDRLLSSVFNTPATPVTNNFQDGITGFWVIDKFADAYKALAGTTYTSLEIAGRPIDGMTANNPLYPNMLVQNFERMRFELPNNSSKVQFGLVNRQLLNK